MNQLFLVFDANYSAPSPSPDPQATSSRGSLAVPQEPLVSAGLPGRPAVPSPRSQHHPPPWFPEQKHRDMGLTYQGQGDGSGVDTRERTGQ